MELYFLRHADAAGQLTQDPAVDSKRPLTTQGVEDTRRAAQGMKRMSLSFDRIVSSPYRRALETAEIVAQGLGYKGKIEPSDALRPGADFKAFSKLLSRFEGDESVLFVGHQPVLGEFISGLVFGEIHAAVDLKKGGLCHIETSELGGNLAELEWLLTSEQLQRYA